MIGDGQVSMGASIVKPNARKVRRIGNGKVLTGFAGSTADALTLLERLEAKLEEHPGQLLRAAVETAKLWRQDKYLRQLDAMLLAADENISICLSGNGDVIEAHNGLLSIGSGGMFALSAARALVDLPDHGAEQIARKAMTIAADICVYTNDKFIVDALDTLPSESTTGGGVELDKESPLSTADNSSGNNLSQ